MSSVRKYSIFGDYVLVNKNSSPVDIPDDILTELRDYNTLWSRYAKEISGKWGLGSIPTEKGFAEWLAKLTREVSNGK